MMPSTCIYCGQDNDPIAGLHVCSTDELRRQLAEARDQIRRLREALEWFMSIDVFGEADEPEYDAARAILKETAP